MHMQEQSPEQSKMEKKESVLCAPKNTGFSVRQSWAQTPASISF